MNLNLGVMMKTAFVCFFGFGSVGIAQDELPSAEELLARSIAYHDPEGQWAEFAGWFEITETRPDGTNRQIQVYWDLPGDHFIYRGGDEKHKIEKQVRQKVCAATVDGSPEFSAELEEKYRLSCDWIQWFRNYYAYLWGLPMKLRDPGTNLSPEVVKDTFAGSEVWRIQVDYDPEVGKDVWYFYLDPATYALVGTRFHKADKSVQENGEYIEFEGEYEFAGMRIPQNRRWYMNEDGRFIGADLLKGASQK